MQTNRKCLFCGTPSNSREHVIPEWLSKAMQIRDFAFQPGHFTEGKGLELRPSVKCSGFRTRQVCGRCNNGWMADLEGWAQGKLSTAVAPSFELHSMRDLTLLDGEGDLMIRWLLKTAIIFELASPRSETSKVNPEMYPVAAGKKAITDFHLWTGFVPDPNFLVHLTRGFPTWNRGVVSPYQIHSASLDFALQLNRLAIRIIRCPEAILGLKLAHLLTDGKAEFRCVPFTPTVQAKIPLPHTHCFPSFYAFLDVLEVNVTPKPKSIVAAICRSPWVSRLVERLGTLAKWRK